MNRPVFISSSGRSGSTSLVRLLEQIDNVEAYHGPGGYLERINCLSYLRSRKMSDITSKEIKKFIEKSRGPLIKSAKSSNKIYVESSWFISAILPEIVELYPEAIIVHLVRDGRDFVRSGMNRFWFSGKPEDLKRNNAWTRDKWMPSKKCKTRFQKICWLWAEQQAVMTDGMSRIPAKNNFGIVRFEDLIAGDIGWFLKKVNISIDKQMYMSKHNKTKKSFVISEWQKWDKAKIRDAKAWMGDELKMFGYSWKQVGKK